MKRCSACRIEKNESEFFRNRAMKDGLTNQCKVCHMAGHRRRMQTEAGRETARRAQRAYRARHPYDPTKYDPVKQKARNAVTWSVIRGTTEKADACERCGAIEALQAHHHRGYDEVHYLDVIWLCVACHTFAHRPTFTTA